MVDKDGYPTREELEKIRKWPYDDPEGVLRFIGERWYWHDWWGEKDGLWVFATGGWSGNEDLIKALQESMVWFAHFAIHSLELPGGFLVVATSESAKEALNRKKRELIDWAWGEVR